MAHLVAGDEFTVSYGPVNFARDNIGVAIRLSTIDPPKEAICTKVVTEWIGPDRKFNRMSPSMHRKMGLIKHPYAQSPV